MALDTDKIIEELKGASILELNDLVKAIEDEFDVTAAAPVAAAGAGDAAAAKSEFGVSAAAGVVVAAAADAGAAAEEKDSFDVELTEVGAEKVKVIKEIRDITGKGLLDAKKLVDGAPVIVKEGASEDDANKIKEQLEGVGATVTLK